MREKFNYHKATFILSMLGFLGSLIFYYTVLREVQGGTIQDEILNRIHSIEKVIVPTKSIFKPQSLCNN